VSEYQPGSQSGWPTQPAASNAGQASSAGQAGYGQASYAQGGYDQAGYGPETGRQSGRVRRRRRRHPVIALVVVLVVIVVILGVGDQVARGYAQNRIASQIQSSGLNTKPSVSIKGWPFLTQVLAHDIKTVDISATNATADTGKLKFDFTAVATGVHLNSSFSGATVNQINGQAVLPFSSVAGLLGVPSGTVTISADPADGPDAIKASAGVVGSLTGTVKLISPSQIALELNSASGLASLFGGSGQAINIDIPTLPAGLVVKSVAVTSQGIVATASASNTTLSQ
jgi:LmeA-like phospholipid-binding